jgi:hypothetical protein
MAAARPLVAPAGGSVCVKDGCTKASLVW